MDADTPPDKASGSDTPTNVHDFQKNVNKRLSAMTDRQDSIQALSMWMIHHKSECQKIASCWLAALKRAKIPRRLHLFYLANDVVQNCKKRNAKIFLLAFKNVLKDAVVLVRDHSIASKIERIFSIWEERNTYFIDFINELRELLKDREKVTEHVSATNFKPQDVTEALSKVKMLETHVGMKQKQVANLKIDASKIEAVKQLKDRSHSHQFAKQFDDSYTKMQGYVKILENEIEQRSHLIELLENGQTFYEVQNDDAMVVANAYRNFGIRINNLRKRLNDYKETLSGDGDSPIPSPSAEAPSPGNTPPQESGDADEMDMEMSDNEESPDKGTIIAAEPFPAASSSSLTDRIANMGSRVPGGAADPRSKSSTSGSSSKQGTKSGKNTNAINYLSSLISAKASQPVRAAKDKAVLKNLEEFAEKVKNPPPVSWSDYKRKQQEKLLAATAAAANAKKEPEHESAKTPESAEKRVPTKPESTTIDNSKSPTNIQDYSPAASVSQYSSQAVVTTAEPDPVPATQVTEVTEITANQEAHQAKQSTENSMDEQPGVSLPVTSQSNEATANNQAVTPHNMNWPPSTSFSHSIPTNFPVTEPSEPTAAADSNPTEMPTMAPVTPMQPPLRPPPMFSGVIRLTSPTTSGSISGPPVRPPPPSARPTAPVSRPPAPVSQPPAPVSRPPAPVTQQPSAAVRVSPAVVVQAPPLLERRNLSTKDQMDALDILDSLHANTVQAQQVPAVSVNNYQPINSSVRLIPEHQQPRQPSVRPMNRPMMRPGAQPIMTLGDRRSIMPVQRSPMGYPTQPPGGHMERHPYSPPRKRPYQDFNPGYPYQGGGGGYY